MTERHDTQGRPVFIYHPDWRRFWRRDGQLHTATVEVDREVGTLEVWFGGPRLAHIHVLDDDNPDISWLIDPETNEIYGVELSLPGPLPEEGRTNDDTLDRG